MAKDEDGSSNLNVDYEIDNIPPYNPRHRDSIAFKKAVYQPPDDIWNLFSEAENCCDIIDYFNALVKVLNINPDTHGLEFYDILKSKLTSWKCQSLWDLLNARQKHSEYQYGNAAKGKNCMIIGGGPIGLRTAIESLLLGCKTVVVEKREEFSRNNVLHLWPFLMTDFRNLGAKKFYGKFGAGCIEHINIRTLQCMLLKVALILGAEIYVGVCFEELVEPTNEETGWTAKYNPENHILSKYEFDIIIGADGKKNVLPGFRQIELRGALAIGITCNFVNNNTIEEARVNEISGISFQYNQEFFHKMEAQYGVRLENIVYYKDETHYFVMTALKASLLKLGVIKQDLSDPVELLSSSNTDNDKLLEFTRSAVNYATDHQLPEDLEFKTLSNGKPDIALFDFTSIKKASNASRIIERKKHKLLMALVGDSLIEPFWPTGSGAGRGVLSALDTAWLIKQFSGSNPPLATMRERENIYKLLSGTTNDSLQKNYKTFTIDPKTRYTAFDSKKVSNMVSLKSLYDTDDVENADFSVMSPIQLKEAHQRRAQGRRRLSSGGSSSKKKSVTSSHVHLHGQKHVKKRHDRSPSKESKPINVVNTKEFWEEHNKKNMSERAKQHVPKQIKLTNVDDDESAGEWSEIDDAAVKEVPVFVTPIEKSSRVGRSLKRQQTDQTKKQTNENKEKSLKRKKSRDHLKRQKPRDDLSPTKGRSGKAKTPDKERSRKRIDSKGSTGKKENTKAKVSAKQEPPRYGHFVQTSPPDHSKENNTQTRLRSNSDEATSCKTKKIPCRKESLTKKESSINRSSTSKKSRRKSSVRLPIKREVRENKDHRSGQTTTKQFTNEQDLTKRHAGSKSSSKLSICSHNENQNAICKRSQNQRKSELNATSSRKKRNLKRSIGRTSLEGKNDQSNCGDQENCVKRMRKGVETKKSSMLLRSADNNTSYLSNTVDSFLKNRTFDFESNTSEIPPPSPFAFESVSNKNTPRLCPLGIRSQIARPGMIGSFLKERRNAVSSVSVFSPVAEVPSPNNEGSQPVSGNAPHMRTLKRQSNFKLVRLNSVKNKRRSMQRGSQNS